MPHIKRSEKRLRREQIKQMNGLARKIDREEAAAIRAKGRSYKRQALHLRQVFAELKAERERQDLSLAEVAARSGMDKGRLSRLENDPHPNVTLQTV